MLTGVAKTVDGGFQRCESPLAGKRETTEFVPLCLDLALEGGDLRVAQQGGGIGLAGGTTLDHAIC